MGFLYDSVLSYFEGSGLEHNANCQERMRVKGSGRCIYPGPRFNFNAGISQASIQLRYCEMHVLKQKP